MAEIIPASHDVVFKALFVRNHDLLRAFLRDVLDLPLTENDEITILNTEYCRRQTQQTEYSCQYGKPQIQYRDAGKKAWI